MMIEPTPLSDALTVTALPAFADNYLWLLHDDNGNAIAIDPGDGDVIEAGLHALGLRLRAIVITHHHPDHIGGVSDLVRSHGCPVFGPADERIATISVVVGDGACIQLGAPRVRLDVMHVPGHTRSHLAYLGHGAAFVGDTLFSAGCGRLFEGTAAQMLESLDRLSALPAATLIFCAHEYTYDNLCFALEWEPHNAALLARFAEVGTRRLKRMGTLPTTIGAELSFNPFLRCEQPEILARLRTASETLPQDRLATFARLRTLKNTYVARH